MDNNPDIAAVAAAIGDPARSRILLALMGGQALTATELALEAEVSPSTTSTHLSRLQSSGLILLQRQGRHRYFRIAGEAVAEIVERLCSLADDLPARGPTRIRVGPADPQLRRARVCYDHLAGEQGVALFDGLVGMQWLELGPDGIEVTSGGERGLKDFGVDVLALRAVKRPLCRACLDWSVRRDHLAGALGAAILTRLYERGWAQRDLVSRAVHFTEGGQRNFRRTFSATVQDRCRPRPLRRVSGV